MYEKIRQEAYNANMLLYKYGIAPFTWGNASQADRESGVFAIKPSGVPYTELTPEQMVIVDFDGNVVDGEYNPSSDTHTHAYLYSHFNGIGGIVHTHSVNAVSFAQAGMDIPVLGTTHCDFSFGAVPCTRPLSDEEIASFYEKNTGFVIVEHFRKNCLDENAVPAVLVKNHGPFCWGKNAVKAAENGAVLEIIAEMAYKTLTLAGKDAEPVGSSLLKKHFERKHGQNAYYGQDKLK